MKELNEMDISNLPDKEFKILVINILIEFEKIMDELSAKQTSTKR